MQNKNIMLKLLKKVSRILKITDIIKEKFYQKSKTNKLLTNQRLKNNLADSFEYPFFTKVFHFV